MSTAKERGVKITWRGKIAYIPPSGTLVRPVDLSYVEIPWILGRYATLHERWKNDDSRIVVQLLNPLQTPRSDLNRTQYLLVDKSCLVPVDDKELFAAKLKGL